MKGAGPLAERTKGSQGKSDSAILRKGVLLPREMGENSCVTGKQEVERAAKESSGRSSPWKSLHLPLLSISIYRRPGS
jgi:hypothetical protein